MSKTTNKVRVVKMTYGSEWQESLGEDFIELYLKALKVHMENNHKKNKVEWCIDDTPVTTFAIGEMINE